MAQKPKSERPAADAGELNPPTQPAWGPPGSQRPRSAHLEQRYPVLRARPRKYFTRVRPR